jgi:hypothetical protein
MRKTTPTSLQSAPATTALLATALGTAFLPAVARADEAAAGPEIVVNGERAADANPNTDAPCKVDRSADGRFTEALRNAPVGKYVCRFAAGEPSGTFRAFA